MLSHEERRLLDYMEESLHEEDAHFTQKFDLATAQQGHRRRAETRLFLLVVVGAFVLSVGVAAMMFDYPIAGSLVAGLGCAVLISVVRAARRNPPRPTPTSTS